eukprot:TRINITY_DN776185_c0_g1_i1.p1 TRINITY_DN776185_c0_g1~~TRINITY_DN776185_c0_g1_i1.p1  ORF type:complete len:278 (-),score=59.64 TRINITY_DN776185_c0_g1_i1:111-854(-)
MLGKEGKSILSEMLNQKLTHGLNKFKKSDKSEQWRREMDPAADFGAVRFPIGDKEIQFEEDFHQIGFRVWDAAKLLCKMFEHGKVMSVKNKEVLEFGSGTGIVGMSLLALGAKHCTFTDMPGLLTKLKGDVNNNFAEEQFDVLPLIWGEHDSFPRKEKYDIIIVSDCMLTALAVPALLESVYALANEETEIFFAHPSQRDGHAKFMELVPSMFELDMIPMESFHPEWSSKEINVFRLRKNVDSVLSP